MYYTRVTLPSDIAKTHELEEFIDSIMGDCHLPEQYRGIVSLPLMEAVCNGIRHGNRNQPDSHISIQCQQEDEKITFSVSDEGQGFPYQDFIENGTYLKSHGLSSIMSLCEEVRFLNKGATICFSIPLPSAAAPIPVREISSTKAIKALKESHKQLSVD